MHTAEIAVQACVAIVPVSTHDTGQADQSQLDDLPTMSVMSYAKPLCKWMHMHGMRMHAAHGCSGASRMHAMQPRAAGMLHQFVCGKSSALLSPFRIDVLRVGVHDECHKSDKCHKGSVHIVRLPEPVV